MAQTITTAQRIVRAVHRDGWPFVAGAAALAILVGLLWAPLFWLFAALAVGCAYFFRDPPRAVPQEPGLILAPADGTVDVVTQTEPVAPDGPAPWRVSIFLSVVDVHVNRAPCDGRIAAVRHRPGGFADARAAAASNHNARQDYELVTEDGTRLYFAQIVGAIARRIVSFVQAEQTVRAGERIGLIRFGSRMDVILPSGLVPCVAIGQRMVAGETVLADRRNSRDTPPTSEVI